MKSLKARKNILSEPKKQLNFLAKGPFEKGTLFSDLGDRVIIPDPLHSYKPSHYLNLEENVKEKF